MVTLWLKYQNPFKNSGLHWYEKNCRSGEDEFAVLSGNPVHIELNVN